VEWNTDQNGRVNYLDASADIGAGLLQDVLQAFTAHCGFICDATFDELA